MKAWNITLAVLAVIISAGGLFLSCDINSSGYGTLIVMLPEGSGAARAGVPIDSTSYASLDKLTYYVNCKGPGKTVTQKINPGITSIDLIPGNWDITVTVFYEEYLNKPLGSKTESISIEEGNVKELPMEITIKTDLIVSFALTWDDGKRREGIVEEYNDSTSGTTGGIMRTGTITVYVLPEEYDEIFSQSSTSNPNILLDFIHTGTEANPAPGGPYQLVNGAPGKIMITGVGGNTRIYSIIIEEIKAGLSITGLSPGGDYDVYIFDTPITSIIDFLSTMYTNCKAIGSTENAKDFWLMDYGKLLNFGDIFDSGNFNPEDFDPSGIYNDFDFAETMWEGTGYYSIVLIYGSNYKVTQASFTNGIGGAKQLSDFQPLSYFGGDDGEPFTITGNQRPEISVVYATELNPGNSTEFESNVLGMGLISGMGIFMNDTVEWIMIPTNGTYQIIVEDDNGYYHKAAAVTITNGGGTVDWNSFTFLQ